MRKRITRVLIVAAAFSGLLVVAPAQDASAHHDRGHHCRANPHKHPGASQQKKHKHRHHKHQCATYPPSFSLTAVRER
jgi:hypothetical protein